MVAERIDVRLDPERRKKLATILARRQVSASLAIRQAIDELYEAELRQMRIEDAKAIRKMSIEDLPEPEELSRQIDETSRVGLP